MSKNNKIYVKVKWKALLIGLLGFIIGSILFGMWMANLY